MLWNRIKKIKNWQQLYMFASLAKMFVTGILLIPLESMQNRIYVIAIELLHIIQVNSIRIYYLFPKIKVLSLLRLMANGLNLTNYGRIKIET